MMGKGGMSVSQTSIFILLVKDQEQFLARVHGRRNRGAGWGTCPPPPNNFAKQNF